jgi:recombination protein RecT
MAQGNGNTAAVAKGAPTVIDTIVHKLSSDAMKKQFATACPTHLKVNAERYVRQFCTQIRLNPKLAECEQSSLVGAMMTGTALGLDPSPSLGEFYIIPYENRKRGTIEAQFQLGYKGMIALAYRGGVKRFEAHAIHEKDHFDYSLGLAPRLEHKPNLFGDRGRAIAYYATAQLPSGEVVFEIMSQTDVEAHMKRYSRSYNDGPWKTEFDEMAKKTVAKSLFKWIPKSTELAVAVSRDGSVARVDDNIRSSEDVLDAEVRYIEPEDVATPSEALAAEILGSPAKRQERKPDTDDFTFDDKTIDNEPVLPLGLSQKEKSVVNKALSELERLRIQFQEGLRMNLTVEESEAWCMKNFGKKLLDLHKDEIKAAILKLNAELDARDGVNSPNLF